MDRPSAAGTVAALIADLSSERPVVRETALARLTVYGARAVVHLTALAGDADAPVASRVAALRALEGSPFFAFLRAKTLATLYASPPAYAHFGYEGEAFSKGGYLLRGFDALDWLPDVPLEDSGPNPAHGG